MQSHKLVYVCKSPFHRLQHEKGFLVSRITSNLAWTTASLSSICSCPTFIGKVPKLLAIPTNNISSWPWPARIVRFINGIDIYSPRPTFFSFMALPITPVTTKSGACMTDFHRFSCCITEILGLIS